MTATPAAPDVPDAPGAPAAAPDLDPVQLVLTFVKLSDKARREGLLSLEAEAEKLANEDLRDAIQEVVDGSPPDIIAQVLDLRLEELRARREAELRRELTYQRLIKTGVLAVQRGHPPRLVRTLLEAQLPPDERSRVREAFAAAMPAFRAPLRRPSEPAPGWTAEDLQDLKIESVVKLSRRDMIRITHELGRKDVAIALRGVSDEVRDRFLMAMSTRAANQIREDMELMGPQRISTIDEAKQRIVQVMRRLAGAKEIGGAEK